jgi:hypothetical protein
MASIIKADNIQKVSDGTNIIKKCGSTTTIGSGACSPIVICGSTVTLGRTGGTVTLACGASQTGFGQTYSAVEYCTTAKTSPFTAAAGTGYFVNTTCAAVTVTLPASPTIGDVVSLKDYANTWDTNNVTLCNNGNKIGGTSAQATLNTKSQSLSFIYADTTKGWLNIQDSNIVEGAQFITATGGTITTCGDYKIHTFTSDGTFCMSAGAGDLSKVDYLVVAGGGAGGAKRLSAGGGAGGYRESHTVPVSGCYTASPLASSTPLGPLTPGAYPITVGGGGTGGTTGVASTNGSNSVFSTITSAGGGAGGGEYCAQYVGQPGGSGGGGGAYSPNPTTSKGLGNTPPVNPPQGNDGGNASTADYRLGGGGGAGAVGETQGSTPSYPGGTGGAGVSSSITGSSVTRGGGGGGGAHEPTPGQGAGGSGGGAPAIQYSTGQSGNAGTANTGGGGGGLANGNPNGTAGYGGAGGSGVVIIRYKYQ